MKKILILLVLLTTLATANEKNIHKGFITSQMAYLLEQDHKLFGKHVLFQNVKETVTYYSGLSHIFKVDYMSIIPLDSEVQKVKKTKYILSEFKTKKPLDFSTLEKANSQFDFYEILNYSDIKYSDVKSFQDDNRCMDEFMKNTSKHNSWISRKTWDSGTHQEWKNTEKCFVGELNYELKKIDVKVQK